MFRDRLFTKSVMAVMKGHDNGDARIEAKVQRSAASTVFLRGPLPVTHIAAVVKAPAVMKDCGRAKHLRLPLPKAAGLGKTDAEEEHSRAVILGMAEAVLMQKGNFLQQKAMPAPIPFLPDRRKTVLHCYPPADRIAEKDTFVKCAIHNKNPFFLYYVWHSNAIFCRLHSTMRDIIYLFCSK